MKMSFMVALLSGAALANPTVDCALKAQGQATITVYAPLLRPNAAYVWHAGGPVCAPEFMVLPEFPSPDIIAEEVAHVVARRAYGCMSDGHGPEWKALFEKSKPIVLACLREKRK